MATAHRELLEETGYVAQTLEYITTIHPVISSQLLLRDCLQHSCCYQRSLFLKLKANHNPSSCALIIKDRCS
ncbi:NUDIX domain-containing protein [Mycobacterium tuberculosis]|uniref:NUDIX domain-containing protein n=1 Tax=Mycobacterium tuberculosis TaxID=1773 RepID=UPI00350E9AE9